MRKDAYSFLMQSWGVWVEVSAAEHVEAFLRVWSLAEYL